MQSLQGAFETRKRSFIRAFFNLHDCTFKDALKTFGDFKNKQKVYVVMIFGMKNYVY